MKRAAAVEPVSIERASEVYAEEFARCYPAPPPEDALGSFALAYVTRDYFGLEFAFNGLNEAARSAFSRLSGRTLPGGQAAGREALRQWAGIPVELIDVRLASRKVANERTSLDHFMRHQPGLAGQSVRWINQQLEAGFDHIVRSGRRYFLANAEGRGIDLSAKGSGLHRLRPLIESILNLREKEALYERACAAQEAMAAPSEPALPVDFPLVDADGQPDFRM